MRCRGPLVALVLPLAALPPGGRPRGLAAADDLLGEGSDVYPSREDDLLDEEMQMRDSEEVPPMKSWQIREIYSRMDLNSDGRLPLEEALRFARVTRVEMATHSVAEVFVHYDKDADGKLDLDEAIASDMVTHSQEAEDAYRKRVKLEKEKFRSADRNGDSYVDREESVSLLFPETNDAVLEITVRERMLEKDRDGDGKLSKEEFWFGDYKETDDRPIVGDGEEEDYRLLDRDSDGFIGLDELKTWEAGALHEEKAVRGMHRIADKDGDGSVTADEMDEARVAISEHESSWFLHHWDMHSAGVAAEEL